MKIYFYYVEFFWNLFKWSWIWNWRKSNSMYWEIYINIYSYKFKKKAWCILWHGRERCLLNNQIPTKFTRNWFTNQTFGSENWEISFLIYLDILGFLFKVFSLMFITCFYGRLCFEVYLLPLYSTFNRIGFQSMCLHRQHTMVWCYNALNYSFVLLFVTYLSLLYLL